LTGHIAPTIAIAVATNQALAGLDRITAATLAIADIVGTGFTIATGIRLTGAFLVAALVIFCAWISITATRRIIGGVLAAAFGIAKVSSARVFVITKYVQSAGAFAFIACGFSGAFVVVVTSLPLVGARVFTTTLWITGVLGAVVSVIAGICFATLAFFIQTRG